MASVTEAQPMRDSMSATAAATALGVTRYSLLKMVGVGQIRVVAEMGSSLRYVTEDVERMASQRRKPEASA